MELGSNRQPSNYWTRSATWAIGLASVTTTLDFVSHPSSPFSVSIHSSLKLTHSPKFSQLFLSPCPPSFSLKIPSPSILASIRQGDFCSKSLHFTTEWKKKMSWHYVPGGHSIDFSRMSVSSFHFASLTPTLSLSFLSISLHLQPFHSFPVYSMCLTLSVSLTIFSEGRASISLSVSCSLSCCLVASIELYTNILHLFHAHKHKTTLHTYSWTLSTLLSDCLLCWNCQEPGKCDYWGLLLTQRDRYMLYICA